MPTFVAQEMDSEEFPTELEINNKGKRGRRHFKVETSVPEDAILYGTQPKRGDPWSAQMPDLVVSSVSVRRWCGRTQVSQVRYGHCIAAVSYETPGSSNNRLPPPIIGAKWSDKKSSSSSTQAYFDINGAGPPIEDGAGVPLETGLVQFEIGVYMAPNQLDRPYWNTLEVERAFNNASIAIPAAYGELQGFTVPAQTAQYMGYVTEKVEELIKVVHTIAVGLSPDYRWRKRDAEGNPLGEVTSRVRTLRSFAGLW